ncbi:hypothetical protein IOC51_23105 [Vibrio parahaemolyticus]|uniref:hypothetical protein n=1 Tax=Vibrio parahaemolyticus TaxID=670 RepID=UPI001E28E653|nr:hypothetical protein [Vibrio parahaemolyticus]MCD1416916.1 hypothetical protein [Vibrio parahaemolyticus]
MKFNLKMLAVTSAIMASSSVFAAATMQAGTEIHWDGKVPMEFADEGVILTSLNGEPLTDALKGGALYLAADGTYTSSSIPLELHHRACDSTGDGVGDSFDGTCDTTAGAAFITGNTADAVGDIIDTAAWELVDARYTIGGREDPTLSGTAKIQMDGGDMTEGAPATTAVARPVFTTINETAPSTAPSMGSQYSVYASIIASDSL